ncbi:MAG TPA: Nramp family divalent metal transporter [Gammaproteobacteria bacterium]
MAESARERPRSRASALWLLGPGLLLAATGVGGGDLATGSIVGALLGTTVLWAAVVGALLKFVVTEGLARWQLATGETLLEGVAHRLGPIAIWLFLPYLFLWSFFVGSAQMSATGIALHAMIPAFDDARTGKIVFGAAAGVVGLLMVLRGGYRLFEAAMRVCIAVMVLTVVVTAVALWPGTAAVLEGLFVPRIPADDPGAVTWTVALIGGIGGTLTVLSYGYWLREEGRSSPEDMRDCRLDLGMGYFMTAVFGVAMIIVGSSIVVEGEGTELLVRLAERLEGVLGPFGKWLFLLGTLGTVFSSLLGVWQGVPYLFADCVGLLARHRGEAAGPVAVSTGSRAYRAYLFAIAIVPMIGLFASFREVQKIYTVSGALFFPLLALALLVFNGRASWVGERFRNGPVTVAALAAVLAFFTWIAIARIEIS